MFSIVYDKKIKRYTKQQWQKLTCGKHPVQQITRRREITPTVHIIKSPIDCVRNGSFAMNRMAYKISSRVQEEKSLKTSEKSMKFFLFVGVRKQAAMLQTATVEGNSLGWKSHRSPDVNNYSLLILEWGPWV